MAAISHSHKFIFIHTYKAAGSSIRRAIEPYVYPNRVKRKVYKWTNLLLNTLGAKEPYKSSVLPQRFKIYPVHIQARELKKWVSPELFDTYYKFAFVRNPWDWQVSLYHFILNTPHQFQHELIKSFKDFDAYIQWRVEHEVRLQKDFVTDESGQSIVDFIGRFENLDEDFSKLCRKLNIKARLPHINVSTHRDFRTYFSDRSAELIANAFKEDIEYFGYSYDMTFGIGSKTSRNGV
jgi:hypothetical protein